MTIEATTETNESGSDWEIVKNDWLAQMGEAVEAGVATEADFKTAEWVLTQERLPKALATSPRVQRLVDAGVLDIEEDGSYAICTGVERTMGEPERGFSKEIAIAGGNRHSQGRVWLHVDVNTRDAFVILPDRFGAPGPMHTFAAADWDAIVAAINEAESHRTR